MLTLKNFYCMSNSIPLSQAVEMTSRYRLNKNSVLATGSDTDILPIAETFEAASVANLLTTPGCESIRVYYGMSEDLYLHAIMVAVDENGADILPSVDYVKGTAGNNPDIVEEGKRCPPYCDLGSVLNP
jgi:hypothetical protein